MPRRLRIEYPGAIYHVINRGDRREDIFRDDQDRVRFLETLQEACGKTQWRVLAYCLMRNHFHLVIETPSANLVAGMKWLLGVYTKRFNIRHKWCGHLFAGRYKALLIEGCEGYLRTVCNYVHLNPVRAKLLDPDNTLETYTWSSYGLYLKPIHQRPPWLYVQRLFGEMGISNDTASERRHFGRAMEAQRNDESPADYEAVRRGWILGSEEFRQEMLEAEADNAGEHHYGSDRFETGQEKARRIIAQELKRMGWKEKELDLKRKGDPEKVKLARRIRAETTMTLRWVAENLRMGSWGYVSNLLNERKSANIED
jgi:REP element-mobilizing transposase RayT